MKKPQITPSEWQVMRVLWAQPHLSSAQIVERLSHTEWQPNTIKTLLNRLIQKGVVTSEQRGKAYFYSPAITEAAHLAEEVEAIAENICTIEAGAFIATTINAVTLSKPDIKRLIAQLTALSAYAPEESTCQCHPGQCKCSLQYPSSIKQST